jgi:hypothetical protein
MTESTLQKLLRLTYTEMTNSYSRLFRNNVGTGWDFTKKRLIAFGLAKGSSDLIGWTNVTITQEMVGSDIAVFTAVETKSKRGRPSTEQLAFVDLVNRCGGIALIAKSVDEVQAEVNSYRPK